MIIGKWEKYELKFLFEAQTSREKLTSKTTYFIKLFNTITKKEGWGECALFKGLSADDIPDYENLLDYYCSYPEEALTCDYSSIRMGFETAFRNIGFLNLENSQSVIEWLSGRKGIRINGLIWMGDKTAMLKRVRNKIENGFSVLKLKIGGINFENECEILNTIRKEYSEHDLTIRLDANGSFSPQNALQRLEILSKFKIHSLEQPLKRGMIRESSHVCNLSPIPIALDEEIIGCKTRQESKWLLDEIKPHYIILKPTLCGGFSGADQWVEVAKEKGIGWWATSSLESNIGLKAIAEWVVSKKSDMVQGLGTGMIYSNNIPSTLELKGEYLYNNGNI